MKDSKKTKQQKNAKNGNNIKNINKKQNSKSKFANFWSNLFKHDISAFKLRKRFYSIVFISLASLFVLSLAFIILDKSAGIIGYNPSNENEGGWPKQVLAPYADMTSWVPVASSYSDNGVANIAKVSSETGLNYFHFGFIQPDTKKPLDDEGNIRWCWGGYASISENGADSYQYAGIINQMQKLRDNGGDFSISFGGQFGKAPWVVSSDSEKLRNMYLDVINTYSCNRIDLDIEEENQGEEANKINAKAVKMAQDETGVSVSLTIPIMPYGWEEKQIKIIKAYLDAGVNISLINSMTMCYGAGLYSYEDYGDASVRAITNAIRQMQEIYSAYGINLTEKQAYNKTGATMAIGYENTLYPTFTADMAKKVADDAKEKNYGMISYWSINRDAKMESNKGVNTIYEFFNAIKTFA
ncbi:MAG: chitinase [Clostridia bacterium]|nr:chitinase [Clostridia bacterium]